MIAYEPWIACDLDGTVAYYDHNRGSNHIGEPIPLMVQAIKDALAKGFKVKIFTARMSNLSYTEKAKMTYIIQDWLEAAGLPRLEITNQKDYGMVELWDDRCRKVKENTGIFLN